VDPFTNLSQEGHPLYPFTPIFRRPNNVIKVVKTNKIEKEFENTIVARMLTIRPIRSPVTTFFI